ncbi:Hypothetical predicted protein [Mytilus galloprovincialis]|uniref:MIB/HERC2 domain-containing protein n=1 Tax=Mytilus galloprovincialis TaxID=29158 RepID=A0A8B6DCU7_MYTGA|nr:Hypothetical predicted protein [Mytilus galloprovincialis]
MLGMADNIGLAVFGRQSRLILETTNDYSLILEHIGKLQPDGNAPIIGGLLMGLAGVLSGPVGRIGDNALQGHMIIFTDETSGHVFPEMEMNVGVTCLFTIGNFRGRPETDSIQQFISSTQTKVYYVPVGDRKNNPILEESVRQTHGKVIQTNEMYRLIRMTQVIGCASQIASEIRYCPHEQTREVIKRKIRMASSHDDSHDDCLDMVMDFLNPLNMENGQGKFVELSASTLQLGDRVRRGPDWSFGDQDRNLPGTVIGQDEDGIIWVEWDHGQENVYAYDEQRHIYKIMKVNEPRILVDEIIAVGCKVVRGHDWKFGDTDGGPGSIGTVLDVRRDGKVVVRWDCKRTGLYKMGHKGRFEIRLKDGNAQTSQQARDRIPGRRHARRRSSSDEEGEYLSDVTTTSTKHASDYVIPIYSDSTVSAIWEYQEDSDWKKYPDEIIVKIERAYQRKQRKTIFEMDRTTYEVHFSEMEQENPQNKSKVTVRRRDVAKVVDSLATHCELKSTKLKEIKELVFTLSEDVNSINEAVRHFKNSYIERIINNGKKSEDAKDRLDIVSVSSSLSGNTDGFPIDKCIPLPEIVTSCPSNNVEKYRQFETNTTDESIEDGGQCDNDNLDVDTPSEENAFQYDNISVSNITDTNCEIDKLDLNCGKKTKNMKLTIYKLCQNLMVKYVERCLGFKSLSTEWNYDNRLSFHSKGFKDTSCSPVSDVKKTVTNKPNIQHQHSDFTDARSQFHSHRSPSSLSGNTDGFPIDKCIPLPEIVTYYPSNNVEKYRQFETIPTDESIEDGGQCDNDNLDVDTPSEENAFQ